jgi:hypothetical protein
MPSIPHEALVEVLRENPALIATLLARAGRLALPDHDHVTAESADLGSALPKELRADLALRFDHLDSPVLGAVIEVQLSIDPDKGFAWPAYAISLRSRHRCPVIVVVITVDRRVADWARKPIVFGPEAGHLTPLVLGPDELPAITDPVEAASSPELATLSALAHGRDDDVEQAARIAAAAVEAVLRLPDRRGVLYYDLIIAALGEAARKAFEMFPRDYTFQDEGLRRAHAEGEARGKAEGKAEGEAKGRAEAVVLVLEARGLGPSADERARILGCADEETLVRWLRAAVSVGAVEELFTH